LKLCQVSTEGFQVGIPADLKILISFDGEMSLAANGNVMKAFGFQQSRMNKLLNLFL
jgi:hypothetical protein